MMAGNGVDRTGRSEVDPGETDPVFRENFAALLARAADRFGEAPAICTRTSVTSFSGLRFRAAEIQRLLREAGVIPGDCCAILLKDPTDAVAAFFAVLGLGAIGLNVNELYRPLQIEYVLEHSGARVLLTSGEVLRQLPREVRTPARVVSLEEGENRAPGEEDFPGNTVPALEVRSVGVSDPAQVTYTSASTGLPSGVVTSHGALWAGVRVVVTSLGLKREDRIASLLPFSFVYGFSQLTTALWLGAPLVVERGTLAAEIVATLRREKVTVLAAVPPLWQQLLAVPSFREEPLEDLRIMTSAGGRLPPATVHSLRTAQPRAKLFIMYGLTEVFRSTCLDPAEVDEYPDSIGRAVPGSVVDVVNDAGGIAAEGEVGELVHGGPTVGIGYLNDPEKTARTFRTNPFLAPGEEEPARVVYSGDLVRRDAEGRLYFISRRDRMIKTLGFRVGPDEIADVIQRSGRVKDVAVVAEPDTIRGERIVACVVPREGATIEEVTRFCRMELPRHMQPARYIVLEEIPKNASGKHDIPVLRRQVTGEEEVERRLGGG
ncbi:MAG: acyl--CoA ligase [Gemmatimonadota bacterium]|jgi:acyl-CoA synthetase (AMP-forming)/AMP-acid ligase II|nr:acyl--CoA ligase [Gemmatimonadota bacterium]